jgi:hypothetical protein
MWCRSSRVVARRDVFAQNEQRSVAEASATITGKNHWPDFG